MVDSKKSMLDYEDKVKKVRQLFIFNWLKYAWQDGESAKMELPHNILWS